MFVYANFLDMTKVYNWHNIIPIQDDVIVIESKSVTEKNAPIPVPTKKSPVPPFPVDVIDVTKDDITEPKSDVTESDVTKIDVTGSNVTEKSAKRIVKSSATDTGEEDGITVEIKDMMNGRDVIVIDEASGDEDEVSHLIILSGRKFLPAA